MYSRYYCVSFNINVQNGTHCTYCGGFRWNLDTINCTLYINTSSSCSYISDNITHVCRSMYPNLLKCTDMESVSIFNITISSLLFLFLYFLFIYLFFQNLTSQMETQCSNSTSNCRFYVAMAIRTICSHDTGNTYIMNIKV